MYIRFGKRTPQSCQNIARSQEVVESRDIWDKFWSKKFKKKVPFESSHTTVHESLNIGVGNYSITALTGGNLGTGTSCFLVASFGRVCFARAVFVDSIEKITIQSQLDRVQS
jgi:hypothetical protein